MSGLAAVTGATSGIGRAYAEALAREGRPLWIHGRRRDVLEEAAHDLVARYGVPVEVMTAELGDARGRRLVAERLAALRDVAFLVNNAGYWLPKDFWEHEPEDITALVGVHVEGPLLLSRAVLPGMRARGRGCIVNVASVAARMPTRMLELYAPLKAALLTHSEALHVALRGSGVRVQALLPGYTRTEFHRRLGMEPDRLARAWMSPDAVVAASRRALAADRPVCVPGWRNRLVFSLIPLLPRRLFYALARRRGLRSRARWRDLAAKGR